MRAGEIYVLTFASGRQYIGQTMVGVRNRYRRHELSAEQGEQKLVCRAWRKYGKPEVKVLAVVQADQLDATEERAIRVFRTRFPHGYNMAHGGSTSPSRALIVAERISAAKKGKAIPRATLEAAHAASRAKVWTPEERAKLSAARMGHPVSEETRRKISAAHRGRVMSPEWITKMAASLRGKKHSAETIAKRVESRKHVRNPPESYVKLWETRRAKYGPSGGSTGRRKRQPKVAA